MQHRAIRSLVILLAAATVACSSSTGPRTDLLEVRSFGKRLTLVNRTDQPVFYFAVETESATLIDWAICVDPAPGSRCSRVPPNESVTIPYAEIYGYEPGDTRATVYHWHIVASANPEMTYASSNFSTLRVRLW
jgi:hypothetical protein